MALLFETCFTYWMPSGRFETFFTYVMSMCAFELVFTFWMSTFCLKLLSDIGWNGLAFVCIHMLDVKLLFGTYFIYWMSSCGFENVWSCFKCWISKVFLWNVLQTEGNTSVSKLCEHVSDVECQVIVSKLV